MQLRHNLLRPQKHAMSGPFKRPVRVWAGTNLVKLGFLCRKGRRRVIGLIWEQRGESPNNRRRPSRDVAGFSEGRRVGYRESRLAREKGSRSAKVPKNVLCGFSSYVFLLLRYSLFRRLSAASAQLKQASRQSANEPNLPDEALL